MMQSYNNVIQFPINKKDYYETNYQRLVRNSRGIILIKIRTTTPGIFLPDVAKQEKIVYLDIQPIAVNDLTFYKDCLRFEASFSGVVFLCRIPYKAIIKMEGEDN